MSKVTIDRKRWGTGLNGDRLADRNRQNCCCLGFACNQLYGVPWNTMRCRAMPHTLVNRGVSKADMPLFLTRLGRLKHSTEFASRAAVINDSRNPELSLPEREQQLIRLFASHGIELEFTG